MAAVKTETNSWRQAVKPLLEQVEGIMGAAVHLELDSEVNGSFARHLLWAAQRTIDQHAHMLRQGEAVDYYSNCIMDVQANVIGARDMTGTVPAMHPLLQTAVSLLKQIESILEEGESAELTSPTPPLPPSEDEVQAFMRGKEKLAELLDQVWATEDDNDWEAKHRPRGVAQNTSAADACLDQLRFDYGAQRGFAAALTGCISIGAAFGLPDSDQVRDLSYEEWAGGPDTVYTCEDGPTDDDQPIGGEQDAVGQSASNGQAACTRICERLNALLAMSFPREEVKSMVAAALEAVREASNTIVMAEARAALNVARKHVHEARYGHEVTASDYVALPGLEELAAGLLEVHRGINAIIGGETWEDRQGKPRSALGQLVEKLVLYINVAENVPDEYCSDALGTLYSFDHETRVGASGSVVLDAELAEERGDEEAARALLPQIRDALRTDLAKIDDTDGRWLHLSACLQLVEQFLGQ